MVTSPQIRDGLTQALTRKAGEKVLQTYLEQATPQRPVAVLFFDLDHFKSINDALGHAVGDAALRFVVRYFLHQVREQGRGEVIRYGGDEFVVVLPGMDRAQAQALAEQALTHFQKHPFPHTQPVYLGLSVGVAVAPHDGRTPREVLEVADRRHYFAKYSGGHRVVGSDRAATRSLIAMPRRPIGQRRQRQRLYRLMGQLSQHRSGVIRVQSAPYGGASLFLAQARQMARLQGYHVLTLQATPTLQVRYLGAFAETLSEAGEIPETIEEALAFLQQRAAEAPQGLLVTVSQAEWLDEGSTALLQRLLNMPPEKRSFVLVYSTFQGSHTPFRAPLFASITLPPLKTAEIRAWLRHALRWEPPEDLVAWIAEVTKGLPLLVHNTLQLLVREGYLQPTASSWEWFHPQQWRPTVPPPPRQWPEVGVPSGLPLLIGRNQDLAHLRSLLRQHGLVTVVARGGEGKTRLLQQLALESTALFPQGVRYLSLADEEQTGQAVQAVAQALGLTLHPRRDPLAQVLEMLRARQMLLILDGLESARQDVIDLVQAIVQEAPQTRVVVGSHERLHLPAEHWLALEGLSAEKPSSPAVRLFLHLARRSGGRCPEGSETLETVTRICRWAQGSPLALRIMASWTTSWTPEEIWRRLQEEAFQTNPMGAVLENFWATLSSSEQQALACLAVFHGPFGAPAARHVAQASPFFLDALATKAYLNRLPGRRFGLHPLLRHFAQERLRAFPPEVERQARQRHAEWYLLRLPFEMGCKNEDEKWDFVAPAEALPNVLTAWRWALQHHRWAWLLDAARWVFSSLGDVNRFVETHRLVNSTLDALRQWPAAQRDEVYHALRALLEMSLAEFEAHLGMKEQAHARFQRVRHRLLHYLSPWQQVHLDLVEGKHAIALGDYDRAVLMLRRSLAFYRRRQALRSQFEALNGLGVVAYNRNDLATARRYFTEALKVAQNMGRSSAVAALLNNLGNIALQEQRYREAKVLLEEAQTYLGDHDAPSLKASLLDSQGRVAVALGEYCAALLILSEAVHHALLSGSMPNALEALCTTAHAWAGMGHLQEAALLTATLLTYEELRKYNREELLRLQARLPAPEGPLWEQNDLRALAQRVRLMGRRWCADGETEPRIGTA